MTKHTTEAPQKTSLATCPCCSGPLGSPFYSVGPVPVHSCLMLDTAEDAAAFPTSTVRLAHCAACGFVANVDFDPRWSAYSPNYEDQQSFSPTFNSFAGQLAQDLVARYELEGQPVVEMGCSKGDFLRLLCEAGGVQAVGIDPSVLPGRIPPPSRGSLEFVAAYYGPEHFEYPARLIVSRHTLEHIQDVHGTLSMMREHAERNPGAAICIEVPDSKRIWEDCAFEDIYYEHCSYFTAGSLARAVRRAGFAVTDLRREYADQYLVIEATLDPAQDRHFEIEETPEELAAMIAHFRANIDAALDTWREALGRADGSVAVWGSGSKCVSFLRTLKATDAVSAIVDINPHRHGRFAPGLGQAIRAPQDLASLSPAQVIVMNDIYLDEISADLGRLGLDPAIATSLRSPG